MHPLTYTDQYQNPNICSSLVLQIKFTKHACNISKYHGQRKSMCPFKATIEHTSVKESPLNSLFTSLFVLLEMDDTVCKGHEGSATVYFDITVV